MNMGAGQIGGIATLLDIDFENAAGFQGTPAATNEAQYIVYFFSHSLLFCVGALIEPHLILTTASCVHGERYKFEVYGGTHKFLLNKGVSRIAEHIVTHRNYNYSTRHKVCSPENIALIVIGGQFSLRTRQEKADFVINRIRYTLPGTEVPIYDNKRGNCRFYGWGSRRNGFLIPLLFDLHRVDVTLLPLDKCDAMWNCGNKYLCVRQPICKSAKFGALCPDDAGTVLECDGYVRGMMTSRLVDRPCGVGFLDMHIYSKFITCGVDDSRDMVSKPKFVTLKQDIS